MIVSSNIRPLRHGEVMAFFDNVDSILAGADPDALQLRAFTDPLLAGYTAMKGLYKAERGSKVTREIIEWDKQRDDFYVALRVILSQHEKAHPVPAERAKARKLYDLFTKFGEDLHRKSYQEQTAGMQSITESIEADADAVAYLASLHLTVYYEAMKNANTSFNDAYLSRNSEYASGSGENLKEVRERTEEAFGTLTKKINAHLELAADPAPYRELAGKIAALVDTYQRAVERRSGDGTVGEAVPDADYNEVESA